jgi:hypothetical protein
MKVLTYTVCVRHKFGTLEEAGGGTNLQKAFDTQAATLKNYVQDGFAKLDAMRAGSQDNASGAVNADRPLYVFVAPEWFFRAQSDVFQFSQGKYYQQEHRDQFAALFKGLSTKDGADVLLVGGSMLWIEPRNRQAAEALRRDTKEYKRRTGAKFAQAGPTKTRPETRLTEEKLVAAERKKLYHGTPPQTWLGYNEALVYFNGVERKRVLKSANASDFDISGRDPVTAHVGMVYGLGAGMFHLPIGGQKFAVAVAICKDHSRVLNYGKLVDLYILLSCSVDMQRLKYVKDGGLIVHADCRNLPTIAGGGQNGTVKTEAGNSFRAGRALIDLDVI